MSLARESRWAWVPMSQTRPCVECHEPEPTHACMVKYIPSLAPRVQAHRGGLASQTRTCMGTFKGVQISPYFSDCDSGYGFFSVDFLPVCKY